ncbi:Clavaminate synthase-like protein [Daldinia caldariorum]|uniref:Clavaminate synthase-like protein n=1 Tax=Daldinia caldariorum TaxID=326644 RepID=UPI00200856D2|nr:Clavaminate synthase-like protein [Daldinia caldariorum]KAI1472998.1 Clavaminate synthase-like protein [Daldinia caldariorum]
MLSKLRLNSPGALARHCFRYSKGRFQFSSTPLTNRSDSQLGAKDNPNLFEDEETETKTEEHVTRVKSLIGIVDLDSFRRDAWVPETPLLLQNFHNLPAMKKWFQHTRSWTSFSSYMQPYEYLLLPYELTVPEASPEEEDSADNVLDCFLAWLYKSSEDQKPRLMISLDAITQALRGDHPFRNSSGFQQFNAPLGLIMSASQFNKTQKEPSKRITSLYVAQSDLNDLPGPLFQDLPVPDIVKYAGKGDIYNSSIWLGLQPTYTPLHRDPNPNLFCQLVGSKRVRLAAPDQGDDIYARVRTLLGSSGNSRLRGTEMMEGRERKLLEFAVEPLDEVLLKPGDGLFIPKGWWHHVVSNGDDGELNASVNWWFR